MNNQSDWLNRDNYTAEQRRHICVQLLSEAQYWDSTQYQKMMHDSTKRPWVGLTVDELITLEQKHIRHEDLSRAIEAKLKEKM